MLERCLTFYSAVSEYLLAVMSDRIANDGVRRAARVDHRRHGRLHPLRHAVLSPGDPGPPGPEPAHVPAGDGLLTALLQQPISSLKGERENQNAHVMMNPVSPDFKVLAVHYIPDIRSAVSLLTF